MGKMEIRREAIERQGSHIVCGGRRFYISGDKKSCSFESGGEGLVHLAIDESTNTHCRIKCFWEPTAIRRQRSQTLVQQQLSNLNKTVADALGGAPYDLLTSIGPFAPFGVVMKNVSGMSWKNLREQAENATQYPPPDWPSFQVRATWAYGLATAVQHMESRGFIHADLSPGNVMVTPSGQTAGDMALVDFDAFVHPAFPHLDTTCKGSEGYAAPEIWSGTSVKVGSDRLGMAVLIQEFLVMGDPTITADEAFKWAYSQDDEIGSRTGEAHPLIAKKYPELAKLVVAALRAGAPASRPDPEAWRALLFALADGTPVRKKLIGVKLESHPILAPNSRMTFADTQTKLDLSLTNYQIRASLERRKDGSVDVVVHAGAQLQVQLPGSKRWQVHKSGAHVNAVAGMVLFDEKGKLNARIDAKEI